MSALAETFMTVTFVLQVIGHCALISSQGMQRKRLDRMADAITQLRCGAHDECGCEPTSGEAGDSK